MKSPERSSEDLRLRTPEPPTLLEGLVLLRPLIPPPLEEEEEEPRGGNPPPKLIEPRLEDKPSVEGRVDDNSEVG